MQFDAFISYSHQDKPTADAACASLEAAGIRCWIAPRDIVGGTTWAKAINDAIENAHVMVLIFSGHANTSQQIEREVMLAVNRRIPLLPIRIEDITPQGSMEYFLGTQHWLDAFPPPLENHFRQLVANVKALLQAGPDAVPQMPSVGAVPPAPPAPRSTRRTVSMVAAAVIAAIAIAATYYLVIGRQELVRTIDTGVAKVDSVAVSPDGTRIASGDWAGDVKIWNFRGALVGPSIGGHSGLSLAYSPDGARIATGSDTTNVKIVDVVSGQTFRTFVGHRSKVMAVAFSPDGTRLVSGGQDKLIKIWDVESGRLLRTIEGQGDMIHAAAFFPDGKRIVSSSDDGAIMVWDAETGSNIFKNTDPTNKVTVAISPDGKWIASGGSDGMVRGWDATTGQPLRRSTVGLGAITSIAFSADGQWIAAAGYNGTLTILDAKSNAPIRKLMHPAPLSAVRFTPDGKWIVTGAEDHSVRIWRAP